MREAYGGAEGIAERRWKPGLEKEQKFWMTKIKRLIKRINKNDSKINELIKKSNEKTSEKTFKKGLTNP